MISVNTNPERTWDENGPGITAVDYKQCAHLMPVKQGVTPSGQEKWSCRFCGENFISNRRRLSHMDELRMVGPLYKQGMAIAEVCKKTGISLLAVTSLYRGFQRRWPKYYPIEIPRVRGELKSKAYVHSLKRDAKKKPQGKMYLLNMYVQPLMN